MTRVQQRAANLLAKLSVVAEAPAREIGPRSKGGKPGHKILEGTLPERARTHAHWRGVFVKAWLNEHDLEKAVTACEAELYALQHGPPISERTEESPDQLFSRIGKESAGLSIAEAAVHFRTTHRTVINARHAAGCDTVDGVALRPVEEAVDVDQLREARRLRELGVSYRAIAPRIGMRSGEGVRKLLNRKAA